jgi:predicted DNA repair protein MutK
MPSGLVALLDDVAALTRLAAASLDDIGGAAAKAGAKAAGVVVDDTAVTPRYVMGFTPERELPIIWKIAKGSLKNKLLFILPAAIALSAFAPWAITPLLALGGAYLCFEATEKIAEKVFGFHPGHHIEEVAAGEKSADEIEREQVSGAIRTDFILSAEIMAIALAEVAQQSLVGQAATLLLVAIVITVGVYGVVGLIVKMDDIGLNLAQRGASGARALGRGLVKGMPYLMKTLEVVGTVAMLWVGGGIVIHGIAEFGWHGPEDVIHGIAHAIAGVTGPFEGALDWVLRALGSAVVGFGLGAAILGVLRLVKPAPAHGEGH